MLLCNCSTVCQADSGWQTSPYLRALLLWKKNHEWFFLILSAFLGEYPILQAKVWAEVTRPLSENVTDVKTIELFDNGGFQDVIKDDGIYSNKFFQTSGQGRYSIKAIVEKSRYFGRNNHMWDKFPVLSIYRSLATKNVLL